MYYLDSHLSNTSTNEKKKNYLNASTSSGVSGIFFPKRRAPVSVIR